MYHITNVTTEYSLHMKLYVKQRETK